MTLRFTEDEFKRRQERRAPTAKKPHQAATYALKPDNARELAIQIRDAGLLQPLLEFCFDCQLDGSGRPWRADLCWPRLKLIIEVDGSVHRIRSRFRGDIKKRQAADRLGYRVVPVTPAQVRNGEALALVREALA